MKYRLLKNLPNHKAGEIVETNKYGLVRTRYECRLCDDCSCYFDPEKRSDFFEPVDERWKPKGHELIYSIVSINKNIIDSYIYNLEFFNLTALKEMTDNHNYFPTREAAERALERIKAVLKEEQEKI